MNEPYLRRSWSASDSSELHLHQPLILQRLLNVAHASTLKDGVIMGPSYWDTSEAQVLMAQHRVRCAGGGGPCPALASGWVLGAATWSQHVQIVLKQHFSLVH